MPDLQLADEASRLVTYLRSADLSLITAESCTAGQISAELSAVAGSGKVMEGGFVVYSPAAKLALLGLDPNWLERFNLTSVEVAEAMARAALQRSPASAALAVTGLLGSEAKDGIPPGTVCFAWAFRLPAGLALFSRRERSTATPRGCVGSHPLGAAAPARIPSTRLARRTRLRRPTEGNHHERTATDPACAAPGPTSRPRKRDAAEAGVRFRRLPSGGQAGG